MELRRELFSTIGGLVLLNLLLAFGTIGLLIRMGPAIDLILQENIYSIEAAEEILTEFALAGGEPLTPNGATHVQLAVATARQNLTEDEERPVLDELERNLPGAIRGEPEPRRQSILQVSKLIELNREAMQIVDQEARQLGTAGAWAAVFIGFLSFLLSLIVVLRLQARFVRPLVDLYEVLESARTGNRLRRCRLQDAPREVIQVTESVNLLLDERLAHGRDPRSSFTPS